MNPSVRVLMLKGLFGLLLLILAISLSHRVTSQKNLHSLPVEKMPNASAVPAENSKSASRQMQNSLFFLSKSPESEVKITQLMANLKTTPNDPELLMTIAEVFLTNNAWQEADGFLARAAIAAPNDFRPYYFIGISKSRQKLYQEASHAFEKSLQRGRMPETQFNLAILYKYHLNQHAKAESLLREVSTTSAANVHLRDKARLELEKK